MERTTNTMKLNKSTSTGKIHFPSTIDSGLCESSSKEKIIVASRSSYSSTSEDSDVHSLHLHVNDVPNWNSLLLFGTQQMLLCISGLLVIPFLISEIACAGQDTIELRVKLISATFVTCGIATLLQTTFGLRLSILHGPSFAFIPSLLAYQALPENVCKFKQNDFVPSEDWMGRVLTMQGSLLCASLLMVFLGATGLIGLFSKYVGPVTIAPLILLLQMGTIPTLVEKLSLHWISIFELGLLIAMAVYLENVEVPIPYYSLKKRSFIVTRVRVFGQFPYLIGIGTAWIICVILTATNLEPAGGEARTDKNATVAVLENSPWFQIPYPGQFGMPRFNVSMFFGFIASCIACMMETIGDYEMCAKVSRQHHPPSASVNRGIVVEGISSCLAATMGVGVGVTTYAENIALMHITRVASRSTMQVAGVMCIVVGLFTKVAALLASIPDAIVGGLLGMGMAMIMGVALSNLRTVDLRLSRNLAVIGISILAGMVVPDFFAKTPIVTGSHDFDQVTNMLLSIRMLIGGLVAFVLDNTVTGATKLQRGFPDPLEKEDMSNAEDDGYSFGETVNSFLSAHPFLTKLPFMPSMKSLERTAEKRDSLTVV